MKVQILIFDGFDELDAIAPFEVLKSAAAVGANIQTTLVSLEGSETIVAAHGLKIKPDAKLEADTDIDVLLIPGGGWSNRAPKGAWAEASKGEIPEKIAQLHQRGVTIAAVCTGAMLVAKSGILKGRPAITHHAATDELTATGARLINARVVDNGDIITAGGVTSGLDLTLWLIERYIGPEVTHEVEQEMEYERRGTVWRQNTLS